MTGLSRAAATLVAAAIGGVLLWASAHIDRTTTGGYWAAYGVVAGAGLLLAVAQIRGRAGNPPAMFGLAFLPVLVTAGWVLVASQPSGNWFRDHALAWSADIGVGDVVSLVGIWLGVLAFAIGYTFGLTLEPAPAPAPVPVGAETPATYDRTAADEPTTAERREVDDVTDRRPVREEARPVR